MIQGNLLGFIMFIFSSVFVAIGYLLLKLPDWIVLITAGLTLTLIDLIFRFTQNKKKGWLTAKNIGGYLYFMPVWTFGIVVVVINLISHITKK